MPNTVVPQLPVTEHVLRSVRAWLHAIYPTPKIWVNVKRPAGAPSRPAFRLEITAGPELSVYAPGVLKVDMTMMVRYAAEGMWDAHHKADKIQAMAIPPFGRIPLYLYNVEWPVLPTLSAAGAGSSIPAATYDVAVAVEDVEGHRSAPGAVQQVVVATGKEIHGTIQAWPGKGLVRNVLVYASPTGTPLKLQSTVAVDPGLAPTAETPFTLTSYNASGSAPATNQRMAFGGLRVESTDGSVMEMPEQEDVWDALVTLRLCAYITRIF